MNIVDTIRTQAEKKNIPIARLERELGFNHGTIRRWDNSEPSIEKVVRVADYLGVSVDCLCGRDVDNEFIEKTVKELTKQSPDEAMLCQVYRQIPEEYRADALYAMIEMKYKYTKQ